MTYLFCRFLGSKKINRTAIDKNKTKQWNPNLFMKRAIKSINFCQTNERKKEIRYKLLIQGKKECH